MRKNQFFTYILMIVFAFGLTFFSASAVSASECHDVHKEDTHIKSGQQIEYWTCSMHPQVNSDKPGKCPICGMDLIPVYKGEEGKIIVDEKTSAILGFKNHPVEKMNLTRTIRVPAKAAQDSELYIAQQEYLSSLGSYQKNKNSGDEQMYRVKETLDAAAFRLSLLGYTAGDIEMLQLSDEPDKSLIYPGKKVWMHADIYDYDLRLVKPGLKASAEIPAYPGEKFTGDIKFVSSILDPKTRSAKARVLFDNPEYKLKLEMYADLEIKISLGRHFVIPENALIDTGTRKVVYLDLGGGRYEMRHLRIGHKSEGYAQVLEGLKEGDLVVADGNFMLDSEATLTGGQSLLYGASEEIEEKQKSTPGGVHRH